MIFTKGLEHVYI